MKIDIIIFLVVLVLVAIWRLSEGNAVQKKKKSSGGQSNAAKPKPVPAQSGKNSNSGGIITIIFFIVMAVFSWYLIRRVRQHETQFLVQQTLPEKSPSVAKAPPQTNLTEAYYGTVTDSTYVEALIMPGITTIVRSGPARYVWENGKEFVDSARGMDTDPNRKVFLSMPTGKAKIYAYRHGESINVTWCQCTLQQLLQEKNQ